MVFGIEPKNFGKSVEEFLRAKHPAKTAANVASKSGCTVAQVEKWLEGASSPSGVAFARLISAYGPEFLAAVLPSQPWVERAVSEQRIECLMAERDALDRRINDYRAGR